MMSRKNHGEKHIFCVLTAVLIGILVSSVIAILSIGVKEFFDLIHDSILQPVHASLILVVLLLSGLAGSLIVKKISPTAEGPGLHVAVEEFHNEEERTPSKNIFYKFAATFTNVAAGSSMGLVSPSSLIGFVTGEKVGESLKIERDLIRTLSLCGMAAAISTLLETPFGAAIFAVEIVYRNKILYRRFFLTLVSSTTAFFFSSLILTDKPDLGLPPMFPDYTLLDLSMILIIALVVTLINILFIKFYQAIHDKIKRPRKGIIDFLKPAFGMVVAGLVMLPVYGYLIDFGYAGGFTESLIPLDSPMSTLIFVSLTLFVTTAIIAGTGNSGGLFMPVLVLGGLIGRVISMNFMDSKPAIFITAGMSAAISTTLNVPIASAVICLELFGPQAILPATIGSLGGYFIGGRFIIYHEIDWQ